jgi:hypothetical protein
MMPADEPPSPHIQGNLTEGSYVDPSPYFVRLRAFELPAR